MWPDASCRSYSSVSTVSFFVGCEGELGGVEPDDAIYVQYLLCTIGTHQASLAASISLSRVCRFWCRFFLTVVLLEKVLNDKMGFLVRKAFFRESIRGGCFGRDRCWSDSSRTSRAVQ